MTQTLVVAGGLGVMTATALIMRALEIPTLLAWIHGPVVLTGTLLLAPMR